jgi:uncharacterized membrane protein
VEVVRDGAREDERIVKTITSSNDRMRTLLLAAILYLIGVVVILLLRPALMFDEDGQWKEFGIISKSHTVFPFWLFCVTWAVLSYCITMFFMGSTHIPTPVDEPMNSPVKSSKKSGIKDENLVEPLSPNKAKKAKKPMKPGYYVLNTEATNAEGAPKYVYYGSEPPEFMGEE